MSDYTIAELEARLAAARAEAAELRNAHAHMDVLERGCAEGADWKRRADAAEAESARLRDALAESEQKRREVRIKYRRQRDEALYALDRVAALHVPSNDDGTGYCVGCWEGGGQDGAVSWDYCPTRAAIDGPGDIETDQDNGQANTCRHLSASGVDTKSGPGKVWRCDHCGLCWIEGYSPYDTTGPGDTTQPEAPGDVCDCGHGRYLHFRGYCHGVHPTTDMCRCQGFAHRPTGPDDRSDG